MKFLLTILMLMTTLIGTSQKTYVYKKNYYTGQTEVFESLGGVPIGMPILKMKINIWGYLELEDLNVQQTVKPTVNPWSRKPNLESYKFTPYMEDYKGILETLQVLNDRFESQNVARMQTTSQNTSWQSDWLKKLAEEANNETRLAKQRQDFFKKFANPPARLEDGWHFCESYYDSDFGKLDVQKGTKIFYFLAKIKNDRIDSLYQTLTPSGNIFTKVNILQGGGVVKCESLIKTEEGAPVYELYFLNGLLDSTSIKKINYATMKVQNKTPHNHIAFFRRSLKFSTNASYSNENFPRAEDQEVALGVDAFKHTDFLILNPSNGNFHLLFMQVGSEPKPVYILNDLKLPNGYKHEGVLN
jgi:hypothetical protein